MSNVHADLPKVMIIEDAIPIQLIIQYSLKEKFQVNMFKSGMEALTYLHKGNLPDIIITDLNIPEISGLELLKQIKSSGLFSAIPVLILSGEESTEVRINCLESGADDFIVKPFNPRELEVRIRIILSRRSQLIS
jgi:DNA-binding response OmpR family regulator